VTAAGLGLGDALEQLAEALEIPVFLAAIALLAWCALEVGRYTVERGRRHRAGRTELRALVRHVRTHPAVAPAAAGGAPSAIARDAVRAIGAAAASGRDAAVEHALADYELAAQRALDRTRLLVRGGPALGLMGTLIPLAPGLAALGRGDVAGLSEHLRSAFGATVVGLLVGTIAFALTLSRTRMYTEDLAALERGAADPLDRDALA